MHGAHALRSGATANGVGFSSTFTAGRSREIAETARSQLPPSADGNEVRLKDGLVRAAMAPTVAPWLSARIGMQGDNEVGLAFTGRAIRVDARHAFESGHLALSLGAAGSMTWRGLDPVGDSTTARIRIRSGYGFDVPVLLGWRSDAGVISAWGGARGGLESLDTSAEIAEPSMALVSDLRLWRRYVGGVAGLSFGFRHVHAALELDVFYQWVSGDLGGSTVRVDGLTLTPAGALIFTF
jgi:hypothetical protein